MKIAIPVDESKDTVCAVFARTPYFAIYNTDNDSIEYKNNPASSANGGAGIKAAQFLVDSAADVLITVRLGENSANILKEADVKIYKSNAIGVKANLDAFKNGQLSELTQFHAGFQGKL